MKALNKIFTILLSICISVAFANITYKAPLEKNEIPNHIQSQFYSSHNENVDVQWFPYPFQYKTAQVQNSRFFALSDMTQNTQYYEAYFNESGKKTKKVFDLNGKLQLQIDINDTENLPQGLANALKSKGYANWEVKNYELVNRVLENKKFHKVILTSFSKTKALYYDDNFNLVKELKWEMNKENYRKNKSIFYKSATDGKKVEKKLIEIPQKVQNKIINSDYFSSDITINEVSSLHIPEHKVIVEYYDLHFAPVYQVTYQEKKKTYKVTLDSNGNELEKVQVVAWKKQPRKLKHLVELQKYTFWQFQNTIDKVKLTDGTYCYRLYATEFGVPQVLAINVK